VEDQPPSHPDDASRDVVSGDPADDAGDDARLAAYAAALADAVDVALGGWVRRCVLTRCAQSGTPVTSEVEQAIDRAAEACRHDVGGRVRALLGTDIDEQSSTPLTLLREAVRYPTGVLEVAGAPPVERDEFQERTFPGDPYDLTPAGFADLDEALAGPGLAWGAAKAHVHRARRRAEGMI
jgi:hypothetical protein